MSRALARAKALSFCAARNWFYRVSAFSKLATLLAAGALAGCATGQDPILQTFSAAFSSDTAADRAQLNPEYRYLRVTIGGRVALLVLGYVDEDARGPVEVWYSAEREAFRLQNGRVIGAVGMTAEWRNVTVPELPPWSGLARTQAPVNWVRTRDVMPGYRYGLRDALVLAPLPPPSKTQLRGIDPQQLTWFEERTESLPPARYAVRVADGRETVVYGEQCLAPEVCFTWQRWPADKSGSE